MSGEPPAAQLDVMKLAQKAQSNPGWPHSPQPLDYQEIATLGRTVIAQNEECDRLRSELAGFQKINASVNEAINRAGIHCAITFAEAIDQIAAERDRLHRELQETSAEVLRLYRNRSDF